MGQCANKLTTHWHIGPQSRFS